MEKIVVERSIWIAAPRERVWQAVTDPEQIPQWFLPVTFAPPMKRDDTGTLSLTLGEMDVAFAVLEGINAPQSVTSRSLPDRLLAVTYTLEEEKDGTQVTVKMTGFEALPDDARHDRLQVSGAAWEKALENLKAYVNGKERPYPQASVAPLFGFWREGKEKIAVERTIWINAPRERVWRAITDPAQVEQWFAPGTKFKSSGSDVGARLYVENPETGAEMYVQVLEVVDPPRQLVTRSLPEPGETSSTTRWQLDEENGGTRLTLVYSGYELMPDDTRYQRMEENAFGFGMMLGNIKAFVEGTPLPQPGGF
jgi:uncharacterized protein YndB with AHSA1/START domain